MKNRNWKRILLNFMGLLLLLICGVAAVGKEALAASAVISLSTGEDEVRKGDKFALIVTVESADDIGNVEMFVAFDSSCVSFIDNGKYTIGGDGLVLVSDWDESKSSQRKKYILEFKAKSPGVCKFSVGDQPAIFLADSNEEMSVSSINMSVTILKKNAVVEEETEAEEKKPEVGVTENSVSDAEREWEENAEAESLEDNIVKEESETNTLDMEVSAGTELEVEDELEVGLEPKLGIYTTNLEDRTVITQYIKITVEKVEEDTLIPSGYMKTNIRMGGESVIAYMPKDDMESQIYLIYGTDANGRTGFYEYNQEEATLKPYVANYEDNAAEPSTEAASANFQMMTAIFILMFVCAVLSVALVLTIRKQKRRPTIDRIEEPDYLKDL